MSINHSGHPTPQRIKNLERHLLGLIQLALSLRSYE